MKRPLRWLGVVVALLLVIALALPFLIDANQFRPTLEAALTQALGREVRLGDLKLSIFSGGVAASDLSIADDPSFSKAAFIQAKSLKVGVELQPLIFSKKLNVTGIEIANPEIALIQSDNGTWNFATLGGKSAAPTPAPSSDSMQNLTVKLVKITNGRLSIKMAGETRPKVLDKLDIQVKDFAADASFPVSLSADIEGGGDVKLDGKAGPIDTADTSQTPFDVTLKLNKLDIAKAGFVRPQTGFGGLLSIDGNAASTGRELHLKGAIEAAQLKLAKNGKPASKSVAFDFAINHNLRQRTGALTRGEVAIGKAKAELTGTYSEANNATVLHMKLAAPGMPVGELEAMLPALDIVLPQGSSLQGGTASANVIVDGPTDKLLSSGTIALQKTRLAGFDLGSQINTIARLTGIKVSPNTDFDNISAAVHSGPEGVKVENISVIAPAIGELTGAGTVSPANALDFRMRAKLHTGGLLASVNPSGNTSVPFFIQGTSSQPKFLPDVKGLVEGIAQQKLAPLTNTDIGKQATGILDMFRKKKPN
ncbi:MAG: AsmA family protein [Acidobacteriota bacterium]